MLAQKYCRQNKGIKYKTFRMKQKEQKFRLRLNKSGLISHSFTGS